MAYASDSLALAALELFVQTGPLREEPDDLVALQAEVAVDTESNLVSAEGLPKDWRFNTDLSRRTGDTWVRAKRSLAVRVPSVVIDVEWNVLINPEHAGFSKVKIVQQMPFRFNKRMFHADNL